MKSLLRAALLLLVLAAFGTGAEAQLVIDGTFGTSITSMSDAAQIESGIDQAISRVEAAIETPITVNIDFENDSSVVLGESDTFFNPLPYSQYLSDLENNQVLSANDKTALASLPVQANNPVNGTANVELTLPLLRALGESFLGDNSITPGHLDSTVSLNLSQMYVSRADVSSTEYDLQAVAAHEIDEVLGIGGAGSQLNNSTTGAVGPTDLFRYSAPGVRSFTQSGSVASYFSLNSGTTDLVHFNQLSIGDYGDWGNGVIPAEQDGNTPPQIQDAFGAPGQDVDLGMNELIALDVVGYNLEAVPEPAAAPLALAGLLAIGVGQVGRIRGVRPDRKR